MNPSDIMLALEAGYSELKLFPAKQAGGTDTLKAFGGPFPQVTFCPTGGVDVNTAPQYLALANVACVGGSWLTPKVLVDQQNWAEIESLARAASQLKKG
jgi:2-dehydro-3-deoxyphosphogluconate aldolase/(4S)-4-hydroxy-2-oxoglutarate aldolase